MKGVQVAAAVIRGTDERVLIAQRPLDKHQGGLWEFPGGKIEPGETPLEALSRELREELGIQLQEARPLIRVQHHYPDKAVSLDVWEVSRFTGEAHGLEGQPLAWVRPRELTNYSFPDANRPIIHAARLPDRYLITPESLPAERLLQGVRQAIAQGIRLIQLRAPQMYSAEYRDLAVDVQGLCAGKAQLMLKGPLEWLGDFPAAGWHLTAQQLREYAPKGRPFPVQRLLAASCHNAEELALASHMGVDFVSLSPIQATDSHPGQPTLGWPQAKALIEGFNQPVFLLGGLSPEDITRAWQNGAQGVAGIRAFWPNP